MTLDHAPVERKEAILSEMGVDVALLTFLQKIGGEIRRKLFGRRKGHQAKAKQAPAVHLRIPERTHRTEQTNQKTGIKVVSYLFFLFKQQLFEVELARFIKKRTIWKKRAALQFQNV